MYKYHLLRWIACILTTYALLTSNALSVEKDRESDLEILSQAPPVQGDQFKCADMVRVVNHLRSLGKERAIDALEEYLKKSPSDIRVHLICRCLFVNPQGWTPPRLGQPWPPVAEGAEKNFPSFPLAFSKRVPFLIVQGYSGKGLPERPGRTLQKCRDLDMIDSDLPTEGYDEAARLLVVSESFQKLYTNDDMKNMMSRIIPKQASTEARPPDKPESDSPQQ